MTIRFTLKATAAFAVLFAIMSASAGSLMLWANAIGFGVLPVIYCMSSRRMRWQNMMTMTSLAIVVAFATGVAAYEAGRAGIDIWQ